MDFLNNIRYGVELERARMDDNGLNESPSLMNTILGGISGASQEGTDRKRAAMGSAADKRQYGDVYTSTTGKTWRPGMSGATAMNEVNQFNEDKADTKSNTNFERSLVPLTKQLEAQSASQSANLKSQENRFFYSDKQNRLDRGLERELSANNQAMQMALGQMNADLADKRMEYDRETRSMDKRDRMIATLMSGLGSLGGAFAL